MPKITKRYVDSVEATGKDFVVWDDEVHGFGLRVKPTGAKSYIIQYRNSHGRERKMTLGKHGVLTPDEARNEARRLLGDVRRGDDPAEKRQEKRQEPTLIEISERYLIEHAELKKKPRSVHEDRRLLKKVILPALGARKIGEIDRTHIGQLHVSQKSTPYQANRCLALLSKLFNLCEKWGLRPDGTNPCRHVEKYRETKKKRYLTPEELARLGGVLSDSANELPQAVAAIGLLLLTGARLGEILTLEWAHVDLEARELRLPDSKTGKKTIPLSDPALQVLGAIPRIVGCKYVISGKKAGQHLIGLPKIWGRIKAKAGLLDVRIHDLRHSYASVAAASGMSLPFIGALLGHKEFATTQGYVHLMNDPLKVAAQQVGARIEAQMQALKKNDP